MVGHRNTGVPKRFQIPMLFSASDGWPYHSKCYSAAVSKAERPPPKK